jgi:hypothetical protein
MILIFFIPVVYSRSFVFHNSNPSCRTAICVQRSGPACLRFLQQIGCHRRDADAHADADADATDSLRACSTADAAAAGGPAGVGWVAPAATAATAVAAAEFVREAREVRARKSR